MSVTKCPRKVYGEVTFETNVSEISEKVERLRSLIKEANSIMEELASEGVWADPYVTIPDSSDNDN